MSLPSVGYCFRFWGPFVIFSTKQSTKTEMILSISSPVIQSAVYTWDVDIRKTLCNRSLLSRGRGGGRCCRGINPKIWLFNHGCVIKIIVSFDSFLMVNFTLPSTTSEMISISTSQTFRSWVVIFHHRRPMVCLSLNLYDTPGLAPRMNVLFWGPGDFPVSYSNRDTLWNAWNLRSGSFMVDTGILLSNME